MSECLIKDNIIVYGRESSVNPFSLVQNSGILIGLHSSLLEFAWFHGKYIVTHPMTETNSYASCVVDFNSLDSFRDLIDNFEELMTSSATGLVLRALNMLLLNVQPLTFPLGKRSQLIQVIFHP